MTCRWTVRAALLAALVVAAGPAAAGEALIVAVEAVPETAGTWRFSVTVRHADAGWDHYADAWQVLSPDGTVLGERELLHPHVDEQPFIRSLTGVAVPGEVSRVTVEARDSVHGWGGAALELALPR